MTPPEYRIVADEHTYCRSEPDPPEVEWGNTGDYGVSVDVRSIHRSNPSNARMGWETSRAYIPDADVPTGSTAYVVVATWTDGDTFGSSGYWCVATVQDTPEAAAAAAENLRQRDDRDYSVPWTGYFAGLEAIEIVPLVVLV